MTSTTENKTTATEQSVDQSGYLRFGLGRLRSVSLQATDFISQKSSIAKSVVDTVTPLVSGPYATITTFGDPYLTKIDAKLDTVATKVQARAAPYQQAVRGKTAWAIARVQAAIKTAEGQLATAQKSPVAQKAKAQFELVLLQAKDTLQSLKDRVSKLTTAVRTGISEAAKRQEIAGILNKAHELLVQVRAVTGFAAKQQGETAAADATSDKPKAE
jgi:hypothetical protein